MIMTNPIHWRSAHDSFTTDDIIPAKSLSDLMRIKTMAFTEAERTHIANLLEKQSELLLEKWKEIPLETYNKWLEYDLIVCNGYIWPFSVFMRFLVRRRHKKILKHIETSRLRYVQLDA